jgi:hypothetical protein
MFSCVSTKTACLPTPIRKLGFGWIENLGGPLIARTQQVVGIRGMEVALERDLARGWFL